MAWPRALLLLYCLWATYRTAHARQLKLSSDSARIRILLVAALEADPVTWSDTGGSWTASDEGQLIRLLKDVAL
jgi:hypothetical protein